MDAGPVLLQKCLDEPDIAAAIGATVRAVQAGLERQRTLLLGPPALRAELASAAFRARGRAAPDAAAWHGPPPGHGQARPYQYTRYLVEETGDLRVLGSVDPSFDRTDDNAGRGVPRWVPAAHLLDVAPRAPSVRGPARYSPRWGRLHVHGARGAAVVCYFGAWGLAAAASSRLCAFHDTALAREAALRGAALADVWRDWLRHMLGDVFGLPAGSGDAFADPRALLAAVESPGETLGAFPPQWVTDGCSREDVLLTEAGAVLRWPCHRSGAASGQVEMARDDALWALKGATEWCVLRRVGVEEGVDTCRMMGRVPALDLNDSEEWWAGRGQAVAPGWSEVRGGSKSADPRGTPLDNTY
ncbi:hypothetical protein diail_7197 [Diaporthe ilicicola]|nr:hypothetical protein diail_7197 [Diaporthe ilicicola]